MRIGDTEAMLIQKLGQPQRIDESGYDFDWYIYNSDYSKYIQVGIANNKVVALYSKADCWRAGQGVKVGATKGEVRATFGAYSVNGYRDMFRIDNHMITMTYDIHRNDTVTSILVVDKYYYNSYFNPTNLSVQKRNRLAMAMASQIVDITNAYRVRMGETVLTVQKKAEDAAQAHSTEMGINNYFAHTSLAGLSVGDRLKAIGISFTQAGENLARGNLDAIGACSKMCISARR